MKPENKTSVTNNSPQPRPREITLGILRQFARCCKVEKRLSLPLRIINPN